MSSSSPRGTDWVAYAAATWAFVFAAFHVVWACGWYVGLHAEEARIAFRKPYTLPYDLVVAAMCVIGGVLALAPVRAWGARLRRPGVRVIAWIGTVLLVLRAVAGFIQLVWLLAAARLALRDVEFWEPWFYLGAILFGVTTWRYWRRLPPSAAATR